MRASAVIVAAGSGLRLGMGQPKAFVTLGGQPMLFYSLRSAAAARSVVEIVVALPEGMAPAARSLAELAGVKIPLKLVPGGPRRQDSVRHALALVSAESELVAIHDAARPLASAALFDACIATAERSGAAIAAIPSADTLKRVVDGQLVATVERAELFQAQTPQAFRRELILRAHRAAYADNWTATDDAQLCERLGATVQVVPGARDNFKITTAEDLKMAEALLGALAG